MLEVRGSQRVAKQHYHLSRGTHAPGALTEDPAAGIQN